MIYSGFGFLQEFIKLQLFIFLSSFQVYDLLVHCWSYNRSSRPNFYEISLFLGRKTDGPSPDAFLVTWSRQACTRLLLTWPSARGLFSHVTSCISTKSLQFCDESLKVWLQLSLYNKYSDPNITCNTTVRDMYIHIQSL